MGGEAAWARLLGTVLILSHEGPIHCLLSPVCWPSLSLTCPL
jgi:hypothetical protein